MDLPLPLDQLRFNLVLWVLITAYGLSGLSSFMAFVPWNNDEDAKILWYSNNCNYSFWLISSLIFYLLWISQFQYARLAYVTMWEIFIIIIAYLYFIVIQNRYLRKNEENLREIRERRLRAIRSKF